MTLCPFSPLCLLRPLSFLSAFGFLGSLGARFATGAVAVAAIALVGAHAQRLNLCRGPQLDEFPHRRRKLAPALVDYRERPRERALDELQHLERTAGGFMLDRRQRPNSHALANFDRALDGLDVVELHRVLRLHAVFAQNAV